MPKKPSRKAFVESLMAEGRERIAEMPDRGPCDVRTRRREEQPLVRATRDDVFEVMKYGTMARNQVMELICDKTSNGDSLLQICAIPGMPTVRQVYAWKRVHPEFKRQLEDAERVRGLRFAERVVDEAEATDSENHKAQKVKIEANKWMASKLDPSRFAERQIQEQQGDLTSIPTAQLIKEFRAAVMGNKEIISKLSDLEKATLGPIIDVEIVSTSPPDGGSDGEPD